MALERHIVVEAALKLLNDVGMDGLTTRRLAQELGVQGPALYWHFENKQELIDAMAQAIMAKAFVPLKPGEDWADWLARRARRARKAMLSYRDGARLLAGFRPRGPLGRLTGDHGSDGQARPGPHGRACERREGAGQESLGEAKAAVAAALAPLLGPLVAAGFSEPDALFATLTVGLFTFGWTMDEQAAQGRNPAPSHKFNPDVGFEFGLETIIAGLKARKAAGGTAACAGPTEAAAD